MTHVPNLKHVPKTKNKNKKYTFNVASWNMNGSNNKTGEIHAFAHHQKLPLSAIAIQEPKTGQIPVTLQHYTRIGHPKSKAIWFLQHNIN